MVQGQPRQGEKIPPSLKVGNNPVLQASDRTGKKEGEAAERGTRFTPRRAEEREEEVKRPPLSQPRQSKKAVHDTGNGGAECGRGFGASQLCVSFHPMRCVLDPTR